MPRADVALWDWKPWPILAKIIVANVTEFSFHLQYPLSSYGSFCKIGGKVYWLQKEWSS